MQQILKIDRPQTKGLNHAENYKIETKYTKAPWTRDIWESTEMQ